MAEASKDVLFDIRLVERNIRQGLVTRQEYDKRLAELADMQSEVDPINLDELAEMTAGRQSAS